MATKYTLGLPPATRKDEIVALDFEIFEADDDHLHLAQGKFACLSVACAAGNFLVTDQPDVKRVMARVGKSVLAMQHAHYDMRYFRKFGVDTDRLAVWDVEIAAHVMYSGYYKFFGLADQARRDLGIFLDKGVREQFTAGPHPLSPEEREYAVLDAVTTRQIALKQMDDMEEAERKIYWEIEYPAYMLIPKLLPARVDRGLWLELATGYAQTYEKLSKQLGFNPRSPAQVQKVIEGLGIQVPDTQADTLKPYMNFKVVKQIVNAREAATNASTYGEKWLLNVAANGDVEGDWQHCGTETDRWACKKPNLQNVPVRKSPRYRNCFTSSIPGELVVSTDANQQEPRCAAYLSQDRVLLDTLRAGISSHVLVGQTIFHKPSFSKKDPRYYLAKIVNLGVLYGQGAYGLAATAEVAVEEADGFIEDYFRRMQGVARWQQQTKDSAFALGYVRGATGMKGWINPHVNQWPRNSVNWPVQNTAAHITKRAIKNFHELTLAHGANFGLMLVVHDELVISAPKGKAKQYAKWAETAWMEAAAQVIPGVPFAADTHIGPTWSKTED